MVHLVSVYFDGGAAKLRGSIIASHPAATGLSPGTTKIYFSLLLSWWTVLRSNAASTKQLISQMQLAVTSIAKYYKKYLTHSC